MLPLGWPPNATAKLPGPPTRALKLEVPAWRPRSASAGWFGVQLSLTRRPALSLLRRFFGGLHRGVEPLSDVVVITDCQGPPANLFRVFSSAGTGEDFHQPGGSSNKFLLRVPLGGRKVGTIFDGLFAVAAIFIELGERVGNVAQAQRIFAL